MVKVVGVRFKKAGKIYYFNPGDLPIAAGDGCIVETARGVEFGEIVIDPKVVPADEVVQPLKPVLRPATVEDYQRLEENKVRAEKAFEIALQKIEEHKLPMRLLEAEYTLDDSKLIFSFTADGRVDFRELVKDLASIFRMRIELRQVGVRDQAKAIGGLGPCGRMLCCATFLGDFEPVTIKMAKDQNLSLNPSKISGVCGRLMCCLKFESEVYEDAKETFGKGCPGCKALAIDEFYHEQEEESDYYSDLLKEDSIQEVDLQMLLETQEVEKMRLGDQGQSKQPPRKKRRRPVKKRVPKEATPQSQKTDQSKEQASKATTPKRRRRPRRRRPQSNSQQKKDD